MDRSPSPALLALDQWRAGRQGRAGLARRRQERLDALVDHARRASPFYRRLYRDVTATAVRLQELPPVTKPELMASFDHWVTDPRLTREGLEAFVADPARVGVPYLGRYFVATTSGTTGEPGLFVHDPFACAVYRSFSWLIDLDWLSARQWLEMARRRGRWAAVVGTGAHYAGAGWMELQRRRNPWRRHHYRVISVQRPVGDVVAELDDFDPAVLTGYPSMLELLAQEAAAGRLRIRPVIVELGGESVDPGGRRRIADLGGAVHDVYSASEFMVLARDCVQGNLHVNEDWAILEPVDRDGRPTRAGEPSETVLLTNLANRVQPLIRYDLGDSVVVAPDPCRCGNPREVITVRGRCDDVLRLLDAQGRTVAIPPLAIGSVAEQVPGVRRSQLVQTSPASVRLLVERAEGATEEVRERARAAVADYLATQGLASVGIVLGDEAPAPTTGGKYRQVRGLRSSTPPDPPGHDQARGSTARARSGGIGS